MLPAIYYDRLTVFECRCRLLVVDSLVSNSIKCQRLQGVKSVVTSETRVFLNSWYVELLSVSSRTGVRFLAHIVRFSWRCASACMFSSIRNSGGSLWTEVKRLLFWSEMQAFSVSTLPHITEKSYFNWLFVSLCENFMLWNFNFMFNILSAYIWLRCYCPWLTAYATDIWYACILLIYTVGLCCGLYYILESML